MKKEINRIIKMFLYGEFSEETEEAVQKWIITEKDEVEKEQASREFWDQLFVLPDKETLVVWERVKNRVGISSHKKRFPHWWKQVAAVLLPLILITGSIFWYYKNGTDSWQEMVVPYGDQQQLVLQDGSSVYLNAGSKFRYPKKFDKKERRVYLEGEGFFEVESHPNTPFFIESTNQTVKVTGTTFNLKAYPEDVQVVTTLYDGKVEVYLDNHTSYPLEPEQQLIYDKTERVPSLRKISDRDASGWTTGALIFMDVTLEEIWSMLERRFNIEIVNNSDVDTTQYRYTARFVKDDSLESILTVLQAITGNITYEVRGDIVYVKERIE